MADDTQLKSQAGVETEAPLGSTGLPEFVPPPQDPSQTDANDATIDLDLPRLVSDYSGLLYRYAFRLTGRQADAEDLTQQTFLIAHQKLHQVRDGAAARGWLFAVLRHVYLRARQKSQVERLATTSLNVELLPEDVDDHPAIDREHIQGAIDALPDAYKLVLLSYYFEDLSYREIAERFELPVGTVMSRLSRAKDHLRVKLLGSLGDNRPCVLGATGNSRSAISRTEKTPTLEGGREF